MEKCVGHSLQLLEIVKNFWHLSENSSHPVVFQAGYGPEWGTYLLSRVAWIVEYRWRAAKIN